MRRMAIYLITCLLVSSAVLQVSAQEPAQKPASTETDKPKSEVQRMLEEAKERGETILASCLENCGKNANEITDGVESGRALRLAKPAYSPLATRAHVSGEVEVQLIIGVDGQVLAASAISGHPLLQPASVAAARDSIFSPTKVNGKPVKVVGVIRYNFASRTAWP